MFRTIRPRKFLITLIVSFSALLAILTLVLSILLYNNFKKVTLETVAVTNSNYLSQISYSADYMNESAKNLILNIYLNTKTIALMYQDENDYDELSKESLRLKQLVESNPFVDSIYVYNKKLNRYLGTGTKLLTLGDPFFDQEAADMIKKRSPVLNPSVRYIKEPYGNGIQKQVFTYLLYELLSTQNEVEGAVILNVKSEYLQNMTEMLKQKSQQSPSEAIILSPSGEWITNSSNLETSSFNNEVRASILNGIKAGESGHFTETLNDMKYLITYTRSQPMGWCFIMLQPYSSVLSKVNQVKNITVQMTLFVLFAGVIAAVFMSRKIHSPLEKLLRKTIKVQDFSNPFKGYYDEIGALDQIVSDSYGSLRMAERKRIMRQFIRNGTLPERKEEMGLSFAVDFERPVILILFRIDHYHDFVQQYSDKERDLLRYAMTNVIQEHLSLSFPCECADLGEDLMLSIIQVSPDKWEGHEAEFMQCLTNAQDWCLTHMKWSFTCMVSDIVMDTGEIPSLLKYLQQLSQYRFVYGHQSILRELHISERPAEVKISAFEETELLDALTNGELLEAKQSFGRLLEKQRGLKYESIVSNMLQIAYVIYNRLDDLEDYGSTHYQKDISRSLKELLDKETLGELQLLMEEAFDRITALVLERKDNRAAVLAESVIAYIHLHYTDKSLCLEAIADYLKYSKVYLSKLFREVFDQSISEYINNYRITKILEKIADNANIDDLLEKNGVENKKYFFTLFKRKMGVSLREYRTMLVVQPLSEDNN